jgi:hypothetical protein
MRGIRAMLATAARAPFPRRRVGYRRRPRGDGGRWPGPRDAFYALGDVDIAYQIFGGGERDIVMTMGWVTHLEVMWELPELFAAG